MEGREVFKHAVGMITDVIVDAFKASGITAEDIDWFIPHQANKRIIDASAHKLHIAPQKVVLTVDMHGNTSAASIPLAISVAVKDGRVKKKVIWCYWKPWVVASPGVRCSCAGKRPVRKSIHCGLVSCHCIDERC